MYKKLNNNRDFKNDYALVGIITIAFILTLTAVCISIGRSIRRTRFERNVCYEKENNEYESCLATVRLPKLKPVSNLTFESNDYKFLPQLSTGIYVYWRENLNDYLAIFSFLSRIVRYVTTEKNNDLTTINEYTLSLKILRDFAFRFFRELPNIIESSKDRTSRLVTAYDFFSTCAYHVDNDEIRFACLRCVRSMAEEPDKSYDRTLDDVTVCRMLVPWLTWNLTLNTFERLTEKYISLLNRFVRHKIIRSPSAFERDRKDNSVALNDTEDVINLQTTIVRDRGRFYFGAIPFYTDIWFRYTYGLDAVRLYDELKACSNNEDQNDNLDATIVSPSQSSSELNFFDLDTLTTIVHKQVKFTAIGLIGRGDIGIPRHWTLPKTRYGVECIPSIGYLRAFAYNYAFDMRIVKSKIPFYVYNEGEFNINTMHAITQRRDFYRPNGPGPRNDIIPIGSVTIDDANETWMRRNCGRVRCRLSTRSRKKITCLYPVKSEGFVAAVDTLGIAIQTYEMFRGLVVCEYVLMDYRNNRLYVYVDITNNTNKRVQYHVASVDSIGGQITHLVNDRVVVYSYRDPDDPALISRLLCEPMTLNDFLTRSDAMIKHSRFYWKGRMTYVTEIETSTTRELIYSTNDMVYVPHRINVRGVTYTFDSKRNQYVFVETKLVSKSFLETTIDRSLPNESYDLEDLPPPPFSINEKEKENEEEIKSDTSRNDENETKEDPDINDLDSHES